MKKREDDMENWYKITLYRLIEVCKTTASKYTRSKVRKALPSDYAYVIEELITEKAEVLDKRLIMILSWIPLLKSVERKTLSLRLQN